MNPSPPNNTYSKMVQRSRCEYVAMDIWGAPKGAISQEGDCSVVVDNLCMNVRFVLYPHPVQATIHTNVTAPSFSPCQDDPHEFLLKVAVVKTGIITCALRKTQPWFIFNSLQILA